MQVHCRSRALVLGAGLTGAVAALELARAGVEVTLVDQDELAMNRASLRNEGKIHLGLVYAGDESAATARLMLEGSLTFRRQLSGLSGALAAALRYSTPFVYLVAADSLLTPDALGERYADIEAHYRDRLRDDPALDYLGSRPHRIFAPLSAGDIASHFRPDRLIGGFRTPELAVDTEALADGVRAALAREGGIRFLGRHRVVAVERRNDGFVVEGDGPGGAWRLEAAQVVNALWENRLKIDRTLGIEPPPGWLHRLKYRIIARLPDRLRGGPSVTMVLGPYGDVVVRRNGTAYFSWYPLGLRGWTHDLAPPDAWNRPCRGELSADEAGAVVHDLLNAIDAWYPGVAASTPIMVDAGAIVAYGTTDVDDPASGLHDRTRVGVASVDGYHSVDPGKMTTAPLFAARAARAVLTAMR